MNMINSENSPLIGARAKIFIKFNGDLKSLAKILTNSLQLPEFHLKSDMDYPHEITAMNESLGFETWLVKSDKVDEYSFEFCSMMCQNAEPDDEHMNDVSKWFAKIVAISTNLDTSIMIQQ